MRPDFKVLLGAARGVEPPMQVHTHPTRVARDLGHFVCRLGAPAAPPRGVGMQVALETGPGANVQYGSPGARPLLGRSRVLTGADGC